MTPLQGPLIKKGPSPLPSPPGGKDRKGPSPSDSPLYIPPLIRKGPMPFISPPKAPQPFRVTLKGLGRVGPFRALLIRGVVWA